MSLLICEQYYKNFNCVVMCVCVCVCVYIYLYVVSVVKVLPPCHPEIKWMASPTKEG